MDIQKTLEDIGIHKIPKYSKHAKYPDTKIIFHNPLSKKLAYISVTNSSDLNLTHLEMVQYFQDYVNSNANKINEKESIENKLNEYIEKNKDEVAKNTIKNLKAIVNQIYTKALNYKYIQDINSQDVYNYIESQSFKKSSKNTYIANLITFNNYLNTHHNANIKSIKMIPTSRKERIEKESFDKYCSIEDMTIIFNELSNTKNKNLYAFYMLGFYAGLRYAEITNLQWSDINLNKKYITIQNKSKSKSTLEFTTKSTKSRNIPISSKLYDYLVNLKDTSKSLNYVIAGDFKTRDSHIMRSTIVDFQNKLNNKYNNQFDYFTPHCARHTFASHAVSNGVSIYKVSKWLGHSSVDITANIYAHLIPSGDSDIDKIF